MRRKKKTNENEMFKKVNFGMCGSDLRCETSMMMDGWVRALTMGWLKSHQNDCPF